MMNTKIIVSAVVGFSLGVAVGSLVRIGDPTSAVSSVVPEQTVSTEQSSTASVTPVQNTVRALRTSAPTGKSTTATVGYRQEAMVIGGQLHLRARELDPGTTNTWEETDYEYATTFQVVALDGRGSTDLYIAGIDSSGRDHIERWTTSTLNGAYFVELPRSSSAIGVPLGAMPSPSIGIQGGQFIPPSQRPRAPRQLRVEICRGAFFGGVRSMIADPDGRFILVLATQPSAIFRIPDAEGAAPVMLFDQQTLTDLDETNAFFPKQHASKGRCYVLDDTLAVSPNRVRYTILWDNDNDGNINSVERLTAAEYVTQGYSGSVWVTNFRQY